MRNPELLSPARLGSIDLKNHVVMAPMTRCRAIGNIANDLMASYYAQRSGAGLIITEGTSPSVNGLGYARIPGIFNAAQTEGWKTTTAAVHARGAKIFLQLMHTGRISHILNMPPGSRIIAPSAVKAAGQMFTDTQQMQDFPLPAAMSAQEIQSTKQEYVSAAINAITAGFDGVELHGANGYLIEQFLSPISNLREDNYGGRIENRCRFALEVAEAVSAAIGKEKTGIRLLPYGIASDMPNYPEIDATYRYLARHLNEIGIAYVHIVDHSAMGSPAVPIEIKQAIRNMFEHSIILSGGYDSLRAETDLASGAAHLIAFGRPFISNPDFVERLEMHQPLSTGYDADLLYSADAKGYTDYPSFEST